MDKMQGNPIPGSMDSISMGQLKAMGPIPPPKPKQSYYDFRYDDEDTMINELEEFYSYAEVTQIDENYKAWQGSFEGEWIKTPLAKRTAHVTLLLESLEHRNSEVRFTNARRLLYILQGVFAEVSSPEHQLYWIVENCKVFRSANGVSILKDALRIANAKHDLLHSWSDADTNDFNISAQDKADFIEEVCTEVSLYLGMLYHVIEVMKGDEEFAEELMALDPPLPVFICHMVAGLKDKSPKGYPVKKLVLALWKCLLACLGGFKELSKAKVLSRELIDLPPLDTTPVPVKSTPADVEVFRQETTIKYPTFVAPPLTTTTSGFSTALNSRLAQVDMSVPLHSHLPYYHQDHPSALMQNSQPLTLPSQPVQQGFQQRNAPLPMTPAPTPPPSPPPKPKKHQYQTDQSRPFLFPFSGKSKALKKALIPYAIDEADRLYGRHMHISVSTWQTLRTREDYILEEAGLGSREPKHDVSSELAFLEEKISEADALCRLAVQNGDRMERVKVKERRESLVRLWRVEQLYAALLPDLSAFVTQLLKMLLATVTAAGGASQNPQSATSSTFPPGAPPATNEHALPPPPLTVEDMDVVRHREITSKAVSAILLLILKWFKASHVMKFHHIGLLLLDSNCLLLILKMFGLQEVSTIVTSKCESQNLNFFCYCHLHYSKSPYPSRPEDQMIAPSRQTVSRVNVFPNGQRVEEEIELLVDFSWRNFFASINFVKIMQKLTKRQAHRIWLLVQYKSSAILKRILKVSHPVLQLYVLKLIKSQVPYCGRKWKQSNMKVITQIYLNCRPDLRDEWLAGSEAEGVNEVVGQEQALRALVKYYNAKRYGNAALQGAHNVHRRSSSMSIPGLEGLYIGPEIANLHRPVGTPNLEVDVFPPPRSHMPDQSIFLPYIPEDIAFEEEYQEYLSDLNVTDEYSGTNVSAPVEFGYTAWSKLSRLPNLADNISDSESVISIGDLGDEPRSEERDVRDENRNDWEHMSPKTMAALPKSPAGANRRSSSGSHLRPVLPFDLDDGSALIDEEMENEEPEKGPMPREGASFAAAEGGRGVDEVEFLYNE